MDKATQADVDTILPLREAAIEALAAYAIEALAAYVAQAGVVAAKVAGDQAIAKGAQAGLDTLLTSAKLLDRELREQIPNAAYEKATEDLTTNGFTPEQVAILGL